MTENRTNKVGADIIDMNVNRMLSGISYSPKDSNMTSLKSGNQETSNQEAPSARPSNTVPLKENSAVDVTQEKVIIYPCPQPSYNPNRCPPDLTKAVKHGFAHRVTRFEASHWLGEVCESTGIPIIFKRLGLLCSMTQLYFLGPAVPMYFLFMKQLAFVALLLSIIPIAILLIDDEPYSWDYHNNMMILFNDQVMLFILCSFAAVLVFFLAMYMFRRNQKQTKLACKKSVVTPNDYTVMASNMGAIYTEEEVRAFFSNYIIPGFSLDLCKISITYDIESYISKIRKLKTLTKAKKEAEEDENYSSSSKIQDIQEEINEIRAFLVQNNSFIGEGRGLKKNGLTFVTFNTKQEAKSVRRKFEFSVLERCMIWVLEKCTDEFPEYFFKENYMNVVKAPELNEILWENLNCNKSKNGIGFLNILCSVILFIVTFFIITVVKKSDIANGAYLLGFIVMVFNEVHGAVISFFASYQLFKTITQFNIAIAQRTAFVQFLNSAAPILVLDLLVYPVSSAEFSLDIAIISIMTFICPIILRIINVHYLKKRIQRRRINTQVKTNSSSYGITQEEANHAYEDADFNVATLYADSVKTFLFTCLFFSISPGIAIVAFVSYFLGYLVDKYNLLRRSLLPSSLRSEVAEAVFECVDFGIFLLALGTNLLLKLNTNTTSSEAICQSISIAGTILALVYLALPHKRFSRYCFSTKKKTAWPDGLFYQQAMEYFSSDYQSFNPISKEVRNPKASQELFKSMINECSSVPDQREAPDLLPLLYYAIKRPSLPEVMRQGYDGLRNPFYIFPQNYGYAASYFSSASVLGKNGQPMKAPLIGDSDKSPRDAKRKTIIKANEMVPSMTSSLEVKEKTLFGSHSNSGKANSIMKDIMMFPSFSGKSATYGIRFSNTSNTSNQKDIVVTSLGDTSDIMLNDKQTSQKNILPAFSPSENSDILEGISPITDVWIATGDQKVKERPLMKK